MPNTMFLEKTGLKVDSTVLYLFGDFVRKQRKGERSRESERDGGVYTE